MWLRSSMSNRYLDRLNKRTGETGMRSEKRVARSMGARLHAGSGASHNAKSDATLGDFRLEMKSTQASSMRLEMGWLSKISSEAAHHGQKPALVVSFTTPDGKPAMKHNAEWVMVPKHVFEELIG
jgi:hypothetical protein